MPHRRSCPRRTHRPFDKNKYATMQAGTSSRGSALLPTSCSLPSERKSSRRIRIRDGADRCLNNLSRRQDNPLSSLQHAHQKRSRTQQKSTSRSIHACSSSGAASVPPASSSSGYFGSDDYRAGQNSDTVHRKLTGTICVLLALGCAWACVANGRAAPAFASLALSTSKITEEGAKLN